MRARSSSKSAPTSDSPFRLTAAGAEKALRTGTGPEAAELRRLFGDTAYEELLQLAADTRTRKRPSTKRHGDMPVVWILPGIMGSTLSEKKSLLGMSFNDLLWLDPIDVAFSHLDRIAIHSGKNIVASGVMLLSYLRLKLRIERAGFDARFYPYDWRQPVDRLGALLLRDVERSPDRNIHLVAHSMGGVVSRAMLKQAAEKGSAAGDRIRSVIMLGTPNRGSYVPVEALRAAYPFLKWVSGMDVGADLRKLTRTVFSGFSGLYDLLPQGGTLGGKSVFDPQNWPNDDLAPRKTLLTDAERIAVALAPADDRFHLIAGIRQSTTVNVEFNNGRFVFLRNRDGDGTVPRDRAEVGCDTWYIDESHGSLPNNRTVEDAVVAMLQGSVPQIDGLLRKESVKWEELQAITRMDEEELQNQLPIGGKRTLPTRGSSPADWREVLAPNLTRATPAQAADPAIPISTPPNTGWSHDLYSVVIGRGTQRLLEFEIFQGDLTHVYTRAYVVGTFTGVDPGGAASAVDQKMNGAIRDFMNRRMFTSQVGEVFVIPTGRFPVRAESILLAGLGAFDRLTPETLEIVAENVIRTFVVTNVEEFATVLFGASANSSTTSTTGQLLRGFLKGLRESDNERRFRRIILCERNADRCAEMKSELIRLASTSLGDGIELRLSDRKIAPEDLAADAATSAARGPATPAESRPIYLITRQVDGLSPNPEATDPRKQKSTGFTRIETSILLPRSKGAVVTGSASLKKTDFDAILKIVADPLFNPKLLEKLGADISQKLLAPVVRTALEELKNPAHPLVVVHDSEASRIPWEAMRIGSWVPALGAGLLRRHLAENLSVARWMATRPAASRLNVLLVVNPTQDLDGAEAEGRMVEALLRSRADTRLEVRSGPNATRARLLEDFRSGQYDVVHYAGHGFFNPDHPGRSGLLCHNQEPLTGTDLIGLSRLPSVVFFNACEVGRIRGVPRKGTRSVHKIGTREPKVTNIGVAEALLRGGVSNYLGTYWPVGDAAADTFSRSFYEAWLSGASLGNAIRESRRKVESIGSVDWADYLFYGNPDFCWRENTP